MTHPDVPVQDTKGTENAAGDARTRFVLDKDGDVWTQRIDGSWRCMALGAWVDNFTDESVLAELFGPLVQLVPVADVAWPLDAASALRAAADDREALVMQDKPPIRGSEWLRRRADSISAAPLSGVSADSEKAGPYHCGSLRNDRHGSCDLQNDHGGNMHSGIIGGSRRWWSRDGEPVDFEPSEPSAGRDVKDRQREDRLPAEIVDAAVTALRSSMDATPWWRERAAEVISAAVAAGLLEHLLETSGYEKQRVGRSTYNGKTALPFTAEQSVYETVARQMPGITFEQRDVWSSPWTPLASSPAVSL